jgi:hydroxyacylglutathione hydrolase
MLFIKRITNKPVTSNSFVVYTHKNGKCIIIDPGSEDCEDLIIFLNENGLTPEYIFLTHEHFDHIWGVNKIKDTYSCKIVCSGNCSEKIGDKKKNMSVFYNQLGFESYTGDILIEDLHYHFDWEGLQFEFIETKGHTEASVCILVDNKLFTGDTIIKNTKTVIKLPGGSKEKLQNSLDAIFAKTNQQTLVYPGHGDPFYLHEITRNSIC